MRIVEYLGYIIGKSEIRPGERKIRATEDFPRPKTVHDVRRFIGLSSFFRRFIKGFANIASPLTDLLRVSKKFEWSKAQENAFETLKKN